MNSFETQAEREDPFEFTTKKIEALLDGEPAGSVQVMALSDTVTLWRIQLDRSIRPRGDSYRVVIPEDVEYAAVQETIRNRILSPQGPEYKIAQEISSNVLNSCKDAFDSPQNLHGTGKSIVDIAQKKLNEHVDRLVSERVENLGDE